MTSTITIGYLKVSTERPYQGTALTEILLSARLKVQGWNWKAVKAAEKVLIVS